LGADYFTKEVLEEFVKSCERKVIGTQTHWWCGECYKNLKKEEVFYIMGFPFCKKHYFEIRKELEKFNANTSK
jgi:Zn finger protein HypA/HybF involved in hydrogenase expression